MAEYKKPNANKKLQNNKTVRQMLDGTHRSQTKKTVGFSDIDLIKEKQQKREIGDRWTDAKGVVWEQKDGFRVKGADRGDRLQEIREYLAKPKVCPECEVDMTKRLDSKYYNMFTMCMDCSIEKENKMRIAGTWKEFERQHILRNVKAWLKDAEAEKEIVKQQLENTSYVNSDGTLEKWELPYDVVEQKQRIDEGFEKFKLNLLTKYRATDEELLELGIGETNGKDE